MAPAKVWVIRRIWIALERRIQAWISLTKYLKYKTKELEEVQWIHHYQLYAHRYTQNKVIIPLTLKVSQDYVEATAIEVQILWELSSCRSRDPPGVRDTQGLTISWTYTRLHKGDREIDRISYETEITPQLADAMVHVEHFSCFTAQDFNRAIRGQQLLGECHHPHYLGKEVPTLQYLALRAIQDGRNPAITPTTLARQNSRDVPKTNSGNTMGVKRRGRKTLQPRRTPWSLAALPLPPCRQ
uniref:Vif n=1 Tax=Simian immunodeficiency virus TaxID=11723 RepID=A0A075T500_SIV|nr:vif [Simian immunodeficiency virus]